MESENKDTSNENLLVKTKTRESENKDMSNENKLLKTKTTGTNDNLYSEDVFLMSLGELLGMFFFVTTLAYGDAYGLFFGIYVVLVVFAPISGAHFNPIVTIAHFICFEKNSQSLKKVIFFILVQLLGAFLAIILKYLVTDSIFAPVVISSSIVNALFQEFFWSGWLVFMNLYICSTKTSPSKHFLVNVAIMAGCVYFNITATGRYTGASLNPAIAIIGNLWGIIIRGPTVYAKSLWINASAPLVGGIAFSIFFKYAFEPIYLKLRDITRKRAKSELVTSDNINKELRGSSDGVDNSE